MKIKSLSTLFVLLGTLLFHPLSAEEISVQEVYSNAMRAFQKGEWSELVSHCEKVSKNFSDTTFARDSIYYMGVGYFQLEDYGLANTKFSNYLKLPGTPKYFEEAIQ